MAILGHIQCRHLAPNICAQFVQPLSQPDMGLHASIGLLEDGWFGDNLGNAGISQFAFNEGNKLRTSHGVKLDAVVHQKVDLGIGGAVSHRLEAIASRSP